MWRLLFAPLLPAALWAQDSAVVEGKVIDAATGMPVPGARVIHQRIDNTPFSIDPSIWNTEAETGDYAPSKTRIAILTSESGAYRFQVESPAAFLLFASCVNYVRHSENVTLLLKRGETSKKRDITLIPEGSIEGRVVDRETGKPIANLVVMAHLQWENAPKGVFLPKGNSGTTDITGRFVITGLQPGEYFIEARMRNAGRVKPPTPQENFRDTARYGYPPTWYPNARSREESAAVRLLQGGALHGIDLKIERTRMAALRGRLIVDEVSSPPEKVMIMLTRLNHGWDSKSFYAEAFGEVKPGEAFEIDNLAPGLYWLHAALSAENPAERRFASRFIDVTDANFDNLDLHLTRGFSISGKVTLAPMEGPPPDERESIEATGIHVSLNPSRRAHVYADRPVQVQSPTGEFILEGIFPEVYQVVLHNQPPDLLLAEVFYNGSLSPHGLEELEPGPVAHRLEIYLRPPGGSLHVRVTDGAKPVPDEEVLLLLEPVDEKALHGISLRRKTDADGQAFFPKLRSGAYRAIAFAPGQQWEFDARLLQRFANGAAVKIGGGLHHLHIRVQD